MDQPVSALEEVQIGVVHGNDGVVGGHESAVAVRKLRAQKPAILSPFPKFAANPRERVARAGRKKVTEG